MLAIVISVLQDPQIATGIPHWLTRLLRLPLRPDLLLFGPKHWAHLSHAPAFGLVVFVALAASLFVFARKRLS
ncbi:MAG: hypothetical protein ABSF92_11165 [Candidatus Acidiferrales bacterium]